MTCSVEGCEKHVYGRQEWCHYHYSRLRPGARCLVEGCERVISSRGMCQMHYVRWLRRGEPEKRYPTSGRRYKSCQVPDCDNGFLGRGLCRAHYDRCRRRGIPISVEALREDELAKAHEILNRWGEVYSLSEATIRTEAKPV